MNRNTNDDKKKIMELLKTIKEGRWQLTQFKSGKTNTTLFCTNDDYKVVAKIYGKNTSDFINREIEKSNISYLHTYGLAPRIMASYENGFIIDYIPGKELQEVEIQAHYEVIARKMRKWHTIKSSGVPTLFKTMLDWYWKAHVHHNSMLENYNIYDFIIETERKVKHCEVGFCHNDLLASNIIILNSPVCEKDLVISSISETSARPMYEVDEVQFIDFEYSGPNYTAYDVANHFAEYVGYSFDKSKMPSESFKQEFIRTYMYSGFTVNDKIIDDFLKDVNVFIPVSHCYWGLWALLKGQTKEKDFDYFKYAKFKLDLVNYKVKNHRSE
ncbi:serine/threonine protein kinase [Vavraia culicis subsp. floridensis]|uniref:ethanolamine kinase n=1 Tax=Vavraia culicis (isolate floridensis) TaxID=948595 RepID=L2GSX0_VAVCU|nr:serine/threonine protein kinase [Vavraia culicis subsp. floridensis]ELA46200.1 serine/threonine protein kinase [Vavraia culicis subsp. floridensis]